MAIMLINREIRKVPSDWVHPIDDLGFAKGVLPEDMPAEGDHICMYETTSEGSPISGVYSDTPEGRQAMAEELAKSENRGLTAGMSAQDWLKIIEGKYAAKDLVTGDIKWGKNER